MIVNITAIIKVHVKRNLQRATNHQMVTKSYEMFFLYRYFMFYFLIFFSLRKLDP